jgi:hypothetical protein
MNQAKLKHIVREAAKQELQEIFGFFKKGDTEKLAQPGEETAPSEVFSMETLRGLKTSKEIRAYTRRTLQELGRGQARVAYAIDKDRILKVSLSDNKTYQNVNEVNNSQCLGPELAVQVLEHDKQFNWIVEERIQPINKEQLLATLNKLMMLTGNVAFQDAFDIKQYFAAISYIVSNDPEVDPRFVNIHKSAFANSSWYQNFLNKTKGCKFASWDFHHANWGVRPGTNQLILLDLGFNQQDLSPEEQFFKEELNNKSGFSIEKLKELSDVLSVQNYCKTHLGSPVGVGQGRIVWKIDDAQVIKVLKKETHENQNELEFKNSMCMSKKYAVQILDYDLNGFKWLVEENVDTFEETDPDGRFAKLFSKKVGFDFDDSGEIADLFAGWPKLDDVRDELTQNSEWFRKFMASLEHCEVSSHDFHPGNWGIRPATGELILIDLGF